MTSRSPFGRALRGSLEKLARPTADEILTVWFWESEADWDAAFPQFGPFLQEYIVPNLAQPPDRVGGEVAVYITR